MKRYITTIISLFLLSAMQVAVGQDSSKLFHPLTKPADNLTIQANRWARSYEAFTVVRDDILAVLKKAPMQHATRAMSNEFVFSLPMPDGRFASFHLAESPVMEKGLADAYPQIKTYCGQGIDDPTATVRLDVTPLGFHAMVIAASGVFFIDPVDRFDAREYISYYKKDALPQDFVQVCLIDEEEESVGLKPASSVMVTTISGYIRNYRLALACTGEYAAYHGGTVLGALSGMVTTLNRVNGVYEREFGIHMNLIENDTLLIYTDAGSDPYSNNDGYNMLGENQINIETLIGSENYDIGHVFSTGGGGIAGLGVICTDSEKAHGVTGLDTPIGDAFDIDYVAHEMGHQYGANHTFNSGVGACNGNRVNSCAYEPGSGSTIMAYAGICGNQDLQAHSDDYFHTRSFAEITNYMITGNGNACPLIDTTTNQAPVINELPGSFTIPMSTPFRLTASASDADGDSITYCWEEYDRGNEGNWNAPVGNAPIFRSFNPVPSGTRIFPKLANILNNTTTIGEIKPTYARTLNFRCVVRDNNLDGAGVTYNPTTVKVIVSAASGPFTVLSANTPGQAWLHASIDSVTWSVSGSDLPPVNTPLVNVLLSVDGGYTWPFVLGSGVPNNGSFSFTVPAITTTTARVMVEGAGNIFFDINNANFTISDGSGIITPKAKDDFVVMPNPTSGEFSLQLDNDERGIQEVMITDLTGRLIQQLSVIKEERQLILPMNLSHLSPGVYLVHIQGKQAKSSRRIIKT